MRRAAIIALLAGCGPSATAPARVPATSEPAAVAPPGDVLIRLARATNGGGADEVEHIFGDPTGVSVERWPLLQGIPLGHILTVRAENLAAPLPDGAAAIAVFGVVGIDGVAITLPARVICLSADELARGPSPAREVLYAPELAFVSAGPPPQPLRFDAVPYDATELRAPADDPEADPLRTFLFTTATASPYAGLSATSSCSGTRSSTTPPASARCT
jgi:hypothetical protein